jgi:ATP synthase proteolipid subunit
MSDPNNYFFGYIGVASALIFANLGAAYGSAKAGVGICSMGVLKPELIMKSVVPVVMAGILGIYGMIVAVIIVQKSNCASNSVPSTGYTANQAYAHLASGLCCGFSSLVTIYSNLGCRFSNWNRRRRWCTSQRATRQNFCRNDINIDLRRGTRIVWAYRIFDIDFSRLTVIDQCLFHYNCNTSYD